MKTSDLSVGMRVAYRPHTYSVPREVEVLALNVEVPADRSRKPPKTGYVEVKDVEYGATMKVRPATLVSTWAEYLAAEEANRKAREAYKALQRAEWLQTAREAKRLSDLALANGHEQGLSYCYYAEIYEVLVEAGFEQTKNPKSSTGDPDFVTAYNSLYDVVTKGEIPLSVAMAAVAQVEKEQQA